MNKTRILIVEDELVVARDIAQQLTALEYEPVGQTARGDEAVQLAGQLRPDLVLMDIELAGPMDGVEAARAIREQFAIPVIFLTAFAGDAMVERAMIAGPFGYIAKPFNERELRMVIEVGLHQYRTEIRLQRSEERMQTVLRTSMDAFWVVDASGCIQEINDVACRLTGYSREELLKMHVTRLDPSRTAEQIAAGIEEIISAHSGLIERQIRCKHGAIRLIEMSVTCPSGAEKLLYCFGRDITERRLNETKLRQLTRAVEQSPASIVITDTAGQITYVNPHFERVTGYTAAEVIGKNPRVLKSGSQSPEYYAELWRTLVAGETWSGEFHNRRKNGSFFWEKVSISPMREPDGRVTHYIAVKEDVTVQKQAETDLARRESHLSAIIENHNGFVWLKDCAGHYLIANRALARCFGFDDPAKMIGKTDFDLWPRSAAMAFRASDHRVMELGHGITFEEPIPMKDQPVWCETYKTVVLDAAGLIIGTAGQAVDISERRHAQHELIRAKEKAESANRTKSAFLAAMSHELRTPLNVINGISATLLEQKLDPAHRHALELSLQGGQNLLTIIEEILDYSALQAGKSHMDVAPFEVAPLLHQVMRQVAELPVAQKLTLTLSYDPALPTRINGDSRRLRQVLLNLLANAVKFTEHGAVHLVVRAQLGARSRPGLHFSVVDTGIGIDPAHREVIFEPFAQADGSIKRRFGGTGLGLAISRSFVRLMGGELRLRSRSGIGSVFHFNLPFDPVPHTMGILSGKGIAALRGERVLIAVTVAKRRRMLGALARAWGMHVTLIDPAKATVFSLIDVAPDGFALVEADAVTPGSPLRSWLDYRRTSRPLPLVWLARCGQMVPEGAGAPWKILTGPIDPAIVAREFTNLVEGRHEASQPAVADPESGLAPLAQRIPLSILAADDVHTNRQVLGMILRHMGYQFRMVENGAEVLTALKIHRYDLILLDVQMPVMDGLTAAREICRLYPNPIFRPKIVALTANALQGDREACLASGMDDYLTKPLVPPTLAACIQKLFSVGSGPAAPTPATSPRERLANLTWIDEVHLQTITQGLPEEQIIAALHGMHTSAAGDFALVFPQVQAACADHNLEALGTSIHGLKGCFQMLGWLQAADGCVQALAEVRMGKFTRWGSFPEELQKLYQNSQAEMARYLAIRSSPATQPM